MPRRGAARTFCAAGVFLIAAAALGLAAQSERRTSVTEPVRQRFAQARKLAQAGRLAEARGEAERVIADAPGFAAAHFLLGWYALFIGESDPVEHFRAAIENDGAYLARIVDDPEIKNFPHLRAQLRKPRLVWPETIR